MTRFGAIAAALAAVLAVALSMGAREPDSGNIGYEIVFDNAFGLTEGADLRIAGVRAGTIENLAITRGYPPKALVEVQLSDPGFADLRTDARCEVRPQSLIGEYFVDCQPGESGRRLRDGGRLPVARTSSTIPFDLVNSVMRRPYRERFRLIIGELGAGLAGRSDDLSEVLRRAHPGLRETSEALRVLGRQTRTIQRVIGDADRVVAALEARKGDVVRFVKEAGETAEITASRREELAESFSLLPTLLTELEPNMARLGELADAQIPLLRDLGAASGDLDTFLARLVPFSENATPAFRELGEASEVGLAAVRATDEELDVLEAGGRGRARDGQAPPPVPADDRRPAPRGRERPAGEGHRSAGARQDRTFPPPSRAASPAWRPSWNYYYWQALATNAYDPVGHILRISAILDLGGCSALLRQPRGASSGAATAGSVPTSRA